MNKQTITAGYTPFVCIPYAYHPDSGGVFMDRNSKKRMNIYLSEDTIERLKQYAWENHTSVSHAITEWIWHTKVSHEQIRGQTSLKL